MVQKNIAIVIVWFSFFPRSFPEWNQVDLSITAVAETEILSQFKSWLAKTADLHQTYQTNLLLTPFWLPYSVRKSLSLYWPTVYNLIILKCGEIDLSRRGNHVPFLMTSYSTSCCSFLRTLECTAPLHHHTTQPLSYPSGTVGAHVYQSIPYYNTIHRSVCSWAGILHLKPLSPRMTIPFQTSHFLTHLLFRGEL